jgi:hypothetical protein
MDAAQEAFAQRCFRIIIHLVCKIMQEKLVMFWAPTSTNVTVVALQQGTAMGENGETPEK